MQEKLSSKKIDELIIRYRSGDLEAGETLLERFRPLIGKYLNLFFYGTFNENDRDIMKFLNTCGKGAPNDTATLLKRNLRPFKAEELSNIARLALLQTAKEFMHISGSYKFALYRLIKGLLNLEEMPDMRLDDEDLYGPPPAPEIDLDEEWVSGVTTGEVFSELSPFERLVIKLVYVDKLPESEICHQLRITKEALPIIKANMKAMLAKKLSLEKSLL